MNIPGFADLQVNGYAGIDFSNPELTGEQFLNACRKLLRQGTVCFLPTIITSSLDTYKRNLGIMADMLEHPDLKEHIPGIHLEGPFLSDVDGARGAHQSHWIRKPEPSLFDELYKWAGEKVRLLTIAADIQGADVLCKHVTEMGIPVSLGHQLAGEADLEKMAASGARCLTHLGNGLPAHIPRHDNPIWAGLANDDLLAMIISDGHHLPASVIKVIIRCKGASHIIVVSDASPIAGLPPGHYRTLGNDVVLEESGKLYNPQTGYLVGSSSTMMACMNHLWSLGLLDLEELLQAGLYNPLRIINVHPSDIKAHGNAEVSYSSTEGFSLHPS